MTDLETRTKEEISPLRIIGATLGYGILGSTFDHPIAGALTGLALSVYSETTNKKFGLVRPAIGMTVGGWVGDKIGFIFNDIITYAGMGLGILAAQGLRKDIPPTSE
ncbi:MAG: hypothetical protein Q7R96_01445 [Nanoarchaeota archaeon]|nr:hypothetical protein [Nanoarchaeota archaeon]